jgi:hypothetical protein
MDINDVSLESEEIFNSIEVHIFNF